MSTDETPADGTRTGAAHDLAPRTREAWQLVRSMLDDLTRIVETDAESELELMEGLRALARLTALCSETSVDADHELPFFRQLNTPIRQLGAANPFVTTHVAILDGRLRYRIRGRRGTVAGLGFQVLAGRGLAPRRIAAYVPDHELPVLPDGDFEIVLSRHEPPPHLCQAALWVDIPDDASAVVASQYVADPVHEDPALHAIEPLDRPAPPSLPHDHALGQQLTELAWSVARLATLHRTVRPELLATPNRMEAIPAALLGTGASTSPDDRCLIGSFRLAADEALVIDLLPPPTRWWSIALESVWHECFDVRSRPTSASNASAARRPDGSVRFVVAARDPGVPGVNWLDTGGRHRGFVTLRWIDHPEAPPLVARVLPLRAVALPD
ncbi:MAG: DUF1214 domain-containing protein [Deltaproteobacteria bacterium]|nr:DUF1214 domain-containing protein [Deltaproteobacteria bacterium]